MDNFTELVESLLETLMTKWKDVNIYTDMQGSWAIFMHREESKSSITK